MTRKWLALDTEQYDPNLKELGPGTFRNDGYILGFSYTDDTGKSEYLNLGHKGVTEEEKARNWAKTRELLLDPCPKLFMNCMYDLGYLCTKYGLEMKGEIYDVAHAESLLDEYRASYSLDSIAFDHLGRKKEKGAIEDFCETHHLKGDPRAHLYLMPYETVAPYAIMDTELLRPILDKQLAKLQSEELIPLFDIERQLFRPFLAMAKNGLKISSERRERILGEHRVDYNRRLDAWNRKFPGVNVNSGKQLVRIFDEYDIPYEVSDGGKKELLEKLGRSVDPKRLKMIDADPLYDELGFTEEERARHRYANPSITAFVLEAAAEEFPIAAEIERLRKLDKLINTFFGDYMDKYAVDGYMHPVYHIFASDEGGTVSGRLSTSKPSCQNLPSKKGDFNPKFRDCIVPEDDHWFGQIDYQSQEWRLLGSYAQGARSDEIREKYNENPDLDMHQTIADWTGLSRKVSKSLGFGLMYGMGAASMAKRYMWTKEKTDAVFRQYNDASPFILETRNRVGQKARERGYIKALLGRRCRFPDKLKAQRKDYLFLNRLIQGSAASMTKKAMVDCWNAGLFNTLIVNSSVHDSVSFCIPKTKEGLEAAMEMKHLMEIATPLKVPVLAELEIGDSWGTVGEYDIDDLRKEL